MDSIIALDFDGVIADTKQQVLSIYSRISKEYDIAEFGTEEGVIEFTKKPFFQGLRKLGFKKEEIPSVVKSFMREWATLTQEMKPFKDIKEILEQLATKSKVYVVSSNQSSNIIDFFNKFNITNIPNEQIFGADVFNHKTDALLNLRSSFPNSNIYFVGDMISDLVEVKKTNTQLNRKAKKQIVSVAALWGYHSKELLEQEKPDMMLNNVTELVTLT